jgi:DNA-directed RNA polymerase specialized sigma24 family protein
MATEFQRREVRERGALEAHRSSLVTAEASEEIEARAACLDHCLMGLPPESRALIERYYRTAPLPQGEARKLLAEQEGLTYSSLKVRAYRIRAQLEECLRLCLEGRT